MLRNQAADLILHERIVTTVPRAKSLSVVFNKIYALLMRGTPYAFTKVHGIIRHKQATTKLFTNLRFRFR
jgi:large subunit ribosomal protein L17